ncbi:unnamed protein product, partial [Laminaria digitata]
MAYAPELANQVQLNLSTGPYGIPLNPTAVLLDFADSASGVPLPWVKPTLVLAYRMSLARADTSSASIYVPLTAANEADDQRAAAWGT